MPVRTEAEALTSVLERNRLQFAWKTADLDDEGFGRTYGPPWDSMDLDADPDGDWRLGVSDTPADIQALWRAAVARSRAVVSDVVGERGLDGPASFTWPGGRTPTVREMLLDVIEEYARHTGHADVLRESVDGRVGEDAPEDFAC